MTTKNPTPLEIRTAKLRTYSLLPLIFLIAIYFESAYFVKSKVSSMIPNISTEKLLYYKTNP